MVSDRKRCCELNLVTSEDGQGFVVGAIGWVCGVGSTSAETRLRGRCWQGSWCVFQSRTQGVALFSPGAE